MQHDVPALRQMRPSGVRTLVHLLQGWQAVRRHSTVKSDPIVSSPDFNSRLYLSLLSTFRSEYNAFFPVAYAALIYVATQAIKVTLPHKMAVSNFVFLNFHLCTLLDLDSCSCLPPWCRRPRRASSRSFTSVPPPLFILCCSTHRRCICLQEVLKALVNAGDVVGIYFALNQKTVGGEARVLSVGLGTLTPPSLAKAPLWLHLCSRPVTDQRCCCCCGC